MDSKKQPLYTLLSGFGPFGNVVDNPTERLARHFETVTVPGHELTICTLPTSFTRAPKLLQETIKQGAADGHPFDVILMLGVAAGSENWRVETQGLNWNDPRIPDVDGLQMSGYPIIPDGPARLPITLSAHQMERAIHATGAPVVLSLSAGAYLCNHLLYTTLYHLGENSQVRAGFLHVPADEQTYADNSVGNDSEENILEENDLVQSEKCAFPFSQHVAVLRSLLEALI